MKKKKTYMSINNILNEGFITNAIEKLLQRNLKKQKPLIDKILKGARDEYKKKIEDVEESHKKFVDSWESYLKMKKDWEKKNKKKYSHYKAVGLSDPEDLK